MTAGSLVALRKPAVRRALRSRETALVALAVAITAGHKPPGLVMTAMVAIVAIGLMLVVAAGGIDFSVGPMAALTAGIAGMPLPMVFLLAVGAGVLCGLVNGFLATRTPVPHYLVTLAMCAVLIGAAPGAPVRDGGMSAVWVAIALALVAHVVLTRTRLGLQVFFVGSSTTAARMSGIRSTRVQVVVYVVSATLAALAGALAAPNLGSGLRLDVTVITAVVIGGVSLSGGRGTVLGTVLGSVLCVQLLEIMDTLGISDYGQRCGQIVVLLLVVTYNEYRLNRQAGLTSSGGSGS
jgi:ribose/xylose/arabinose/galactoside ABC-type transport system permease subunit